MRAQNLTSFSLEDFKSQFDTLLKSGFNPTAAILFIDPRLDGEAVSSFLSEQEIDCLITSSAGEICEGEIHEESIVAIFLELSKDKFRFFIEEVQDNSVEVGTKAANFAKASFDNPAFIMCLGMNIHGEEVIESLIDVCGNDTAIFGGMASNVVEEGRPYILHNGKKKYQGIAMLIFDGDQVEINGFAVNGWEPLGTEHTITKSKFNEIFEIDNVPALDFFYKYFGFYQDPLALDDISSVNSMYPLQVMREGDLVMRAPYLSNKETKSLMMSGPVKEGERFKFSIAPSFDVIDNTINVFKEYKEKIKAPDAIVLFSCKARHWSFGPMLEKEVEALNDLWKVPYIGFFTFGEIGQTESKKTHFFNETCSLVTFREI